MAELIVTTTPTVEGRMATHYLGVVAGEAIMGANISLPASATSLAAVPAPMKK